METIFQFFPQKKMFSFFQWFFLLLYVFVFLYPKQQEPSCHQKHLVNKQIIHLQKRMHLFFSCRHYDTLPQHQQGPLDDLQQLNIFHLQEYYLIHLLHIFLYMYLQAIQKLQVLTCFVYGHQHR